MIKFDYSVGVEVCKNLMSHTINMKINQNWFNTDTESIKCNIYLATIDISMGVLLF